MINNSIDLKDIISSFDKIFSELSSKDTRNFKDDLLAFFGKDDKIQASSEKISMTNDDKSDDLKSLLITMLSDKFDPQTNMGNNKQGDLLSNKDDNLSLEKISNSLNQINNLDDYDLNHINNVINSLSIKKDDNKNDSKDDHENINKDDDKNDNAFLNIPEIPSYNQNISIYNNLENKIDNNVNLSNEESIDSLKLESPKRDYAIYYQTIQSAKKDVNLDLESVVNHNDDNNLGEKFNIMSFHDMQGIMDYNEEKKSSVTHDNVQVQKSDSFQKGIDVISDYKTSNSLDGTKSFSMTVLTATEHPVQIRIEGQSGATVNIILQSDDSNVARHLLLNKQDLVSALNIAGIETHHLKIEISSISNIDDKSNEQSSGTFGGDSSSFSNNRQNNNNGNENTNDNVFSGQISYGDENIDENYSHNDEHLYVNNLNITA